MLSTHSSVMASVLPTFPTADEPALELRCQREQEGE
jgi:hypothetical protein